MQGKTYLNRYRIVRQLGEGGMGKVFLARQTDLNRDVVIKVMHEHVANDPRFQQCFLQETQTMAQFQHPYAVALFDAQLDSEDGPFIIMEYVKGKTLDVVLRENKRFTPQRASRLLSQVCEVLHDAHSKGIVHRDLKPSNLMILDADTQYEKLKVMDFGLAKFTVNPTIKAVSEATNEYMLGTPAYVSPEQARGEETDHRTDIYSMGVIVYELISGHLPFDGMSTMDTLLAHAIEPPPPMTTEEVYVPSAIERVIQKCLAKQPNERFQSARDFFNKYMEALSANDPGPDAMQMIDPAALAAGHGEGIAYRTGLASAHPHAPPPLPDVMDPGTLAFQMQAWMPQAVASFKLNGFIMDVRGELIESQPGRIRVRLGAKGTPYAPAAGKWFNWQAAKPDTEMELQLYESTDPKHKNFVWITVICRYIGKKLQAEWHERADQVFRDLRGYLMGNVPQESLH
jgi:predicted Ser/Thr protein kinase